ncbi:MAG: NAD(P)H-dependent flavin oxidoreductase [Chroococcales cyanobacterium]
MNQPLAPLQIGKHTVPYPILQGAMGVRVSGAKLASAVANAGGIGIIASAGLGLKSPYYRKMRFPLANRLALIDELRNARQISPEGVIGVNVWVAAKDYLISAQTAAEYGANLVVTEAGLPFLLPQCMKQYPHVALVPTVSNFEDAKRLCEMWRKEYSRFPDALIVENAKGIGGHLGARLDIAQVLTQLRDYLENDLGIQIPLIVTGGIWDRNDINQILALGANGVQIGTRFITTEECDADLRYKLFHLQAKPKDLVIVPSPVGKSGRAIRNEFAEKAIAGSSEIEQRCIANCLESCLCRDAKKTYCLLQGLANASSGDLGNGLVFSGANAGRCDRIVSVTELMTELVKTRSTVTV